MLDSPVMRHWPSTLSSYPAGDTTGSVHLFAVFESAPDYFRSVAVHSAEVTAVAFAPPFSAGPRSCQLLAVGAKSGTLAVLDSMHGYAVVAQLQPAGGAPVVSLQWVQQGGQLRLLAAARDGRLAAHTLEASGQGQLAFTLEEGFCPSAPKGALVGMQAAVWGQVAAAGSKEGGVHIFDAITGEDLVQLTAERNAGVNWPHAAMGPTRVTLGVEVMRCLSMHLDMNWASPPCLLRSTMLACCPVQATSAPLRWMKASPSV